MIKEEAIEILSDMRAEYNIFSDDEEEATRYHALSWAIQALNEQQRTERKRGKWIVSFFRGNWKDIDIKTCSECGMTFRNLDVANYCPNCGLPMETKVEK